MLHHTQTRAEKRAKRTRTKGTKGEKPQKQRRPPTPRGALQCARRTRDLGQATVGVQVKNFCGLPVLGLVAGLVAQQGGLMHLTAPLELRFALCTLDAVNATRHIPSQSARLARHLRIERVVGAAHHGRFLPVASACPARDALKDTMRSRLVSLRGVASPPLLLVCGWQLR